MKEMQTAAQAIGLRLQTAEISTEGEFEDALVAKNKAGVQALILLSNAIFSAEELSISLASTSCQPCIFSSICRRGGLMSYGPSDADFSAAPRGYVDRILRDAKPGDLPVEQPTKFDLYINLSTAKALGVAIPESFVDRAAKVIE
jgi:putative tryptophan/tyrosine transport system substrate-binding protein